MAQHELPTVRRARRTASHPATSHRTSHRLTSHRTASHRLRGVVAVVALLLGLVVPVTTASAAPPDATGKPLSVMTRNVYLGGNIMRPIEATAGKSGLGALVALGNANHALRDVVRQTDFEARSELLAAEIAATKPDVVGLQEVALWRHGPMQLLRLGVPNATEVDQDFLQILTDDLAATGARYRVVHVQTASDVEVPSFLGNPFTLSATETADVRLTMRDVLLVRDEGGITVQASGGGRYLARLPVIVGGVPLAFVRGYNWADLRVGSTPLRVVNTHLESASSDIAMAQAFELVNGPARSARTTVVLCDCNSDPRDDSVKPTDPFGTPHSGPYDYLVRKGFADQWLTMAPAEEGWTSGLSETVDDPTPAGFDHRIDLVLAKGAAGARVVADAGEVTGDELSDRDPVTGLWPSDHAGVVLRLRGLG